MIFCDSRVLQFCVYCRDTLDTYLLQHQFCTCDQRKKETLDRWAENDVRVTSCPENFDHKYGFVENRCQTLSLYRVLDAIARSVLDTSDNTAQMDRQGRAAAAARRADAVWSATASHPVSVCGPRGLVSGVDSD